MERDFDTTRAFTNLSYSGTLAEFSDIRYIVNHSGAAVPLLAGRIKDRVPGAMRARFVPARGRGLPARGRTDNHDCYFTVTDSANLPEFKERTLKALRYQEEISFTFDKKLNILKIASGSS